MSLTVLEYGTIASELGVSFRPPIPGPERDLINGFLEQRTTKIPAGRHCTVFREPRVETGFPDLVLVDWCVATAQRWSPQRAELEKNDLRVLQYMHASSHASDDHLSSVFGRHLTRSLERLEAAELVRRARQRWTPRPLRQTFATQQILAVEAKVNEWDRALRQAILNTWFASESVILVPHVPRGSRLLEAAASLGIGVYTQDGPVLTSLSCRSVNLPCSYASWLFNEWAWRAANQNGHFAR